MSLAMRGGAEMRLSVPGIMAARGMAIDFMVAVLRSLEVTVDVEHAVVAAFGEAFNNVVIHSYRDVAGEIDIEVECVRDRLIVRLYDRGEGFDPKNVRARDEDALPEGGMGLFIMMRTMDSVRWYRDHGRNVVALAKTIAQTT